MKILTIILIGILLMGAGYRFSLSEYEEECFGYYFESYNKTQYYCDSNLRHLMFCGSGQTKDVSYNRLEIDCNCPEVKTRTVIVWNETEQCGKYHLVRKVS